MLLSLDHLLLPDCLNLIFYSSQRKVTCPEKGYAISGLVLLIVSILVSFLFSSFLDVAESMKTGRLPRIDEVLVPAIQNLRSPVLTKVVKGITVLGGQWAYLVLMVLIGYVLYLRNRKWQLVLPPLFTLLSAFALNTIVKFAVNRPRPASHEHLVKVGEWTLSYPSGHSMTSIAFYGFLIYLVYQNMTVRWVKRLTIVLLMVVILTVGASRVYLGVHYPSDVIAGFAAGLIWLIACVLLMRFRHRRKGLGDVKQD